MKTLSNAELILKLSTAVKLERRTTAEILELIREVDQRRLYLELGHTSLFAYLTKGLGYSAASAQRRIESARLMAQVPQIKSEISEGNLCLMQTSLLAQSLKNVEKSVDPVEIVEKIKGQDVSRTQAILAREFDQPIMQFEKRRMQQDESLRLEITLSKEEQKLFARLRDLVSHIKPSLGWKELFVLAAEDAIAKRDVTAKQPRHRVTAKMEVAISQKRPTVPMSIRRATIQRDQCCQWRDPKTGQKCGSTFQLQIDHIKSVWQGGGSEPENLQVLCAAHNRWKFRKETEAL